MPRAHRLRSFSPLHPTPRPPSANLHHHANSRSRAERRRSLFAPKPGFITMLLGRLEVVVVATAFLLAFLQAPFAVASDVPAILKLERRNTLPAGVVELPLNGTGQVLIHGPYLTRVKLGSPPQSFDVLIDTGSSIPIVGCETSAGLRTRLLHPRSSASASILTCPDQRCQALGDAMYGGCNASTNGCVYDLEYGNGDSATASSAVGYYLSDSVHFDGLSTPQRIIFGCTTSWSGQLALGAAFDGIFSFAPFGLSFISQLYSLGVSGKVFTLCMHSPTGGGVLAFGEAMEPALTYTPLMPSQKYYILNLQSIAVNGQTLPIDRSVFEPSPDQFTFVDSGTTLAYLADGAYEPFINAISATIPSPVLRLTGRYGEPCFATPISSFPFVELRFMGGAKMILQPQNYLHYEEPSIYCIAWLRNKGRQVTILGDIVLVDKILVHDLENMRLGWMNYDCSQPINVTAYANSGQSFPVTSFRVLIAFIICMMLHI